jgi:hypothetical protein
MTGHCKITLTILPLISNTALLLRVCGRSYVCPSEHFAVKPGEDVIPVKSCLPGQRHNPIIGDTMGLLRNAVVRDHCVRALKSPWDGGG